MKDIQGWPMNIKRIAAVLVALLLVIGCTGLDRRRAKDVPAEDQAARSFFASLDRLVDLHDVRDAGQFPIPGFPYLRTDRFLEAMQSRLDTPERQRLWVDRMQQADLESRRREIDNLPEAALGALSEWIGAAATSETVYLRLKAASNQLLETDLLQAGYYERLKALNDVPDEYSTAMRVFLLYPIAAVPVTMATIRAYDKYRKWHNTPPEELTVMGGWMRFAPMAAYRPFTQGAIDRLFVRAERDAFGLPRWTPEDVVLLAEMFAPTITQDVAEDYDRFGAVQWRQGRVAIDHDQPVVYHYVSHAFLEGEPVVQMNYSLWYSERAGENAPTIEHGPLDGLTLRFTFNTDGVVIMADVMNSCGCYHFFIPARQRVAEVIKRENQLEPLVPAWLPRDVPNERIDLMVNSGWHQVQHVGTEKPDRGRKLSYRLVPYATLESLPTAEGTRDSAFTPEGIMKDSWRMEPYIFFFHGHSQGRLHASARTPCHQDGGTRAFYQSLSLG
jgi:hypothetical protein